jgi:hypothetical protein
MTERIHEHLYNDDDENDIVEIGNDGEIIESPSKKQKKSICPI